MNVGKNLGTALSLGYDKETMENAVHNQIKRGNTVPSENQNIPRCKF